MGSQCPVRGKTTWEDPGKLVGVLRTGEPRVPLCRDPSQFSLPGGPLHPCACCLGRPLSSCSLQAPSTALSIATSNTCMLSCLSPMLEFGPVVPGQGHWGSDEGGGASQGFLGLFWVRKPQGGDARDGQWTMRLLGQASRSLASPRTLTASGHGFSPPCLALLLWEMGQLPRPRERQSPRW